MVSGAVSDVDSPHRYDFPQGKPVAIIIGIGAAPVSMSLPVAAIVVVLAADDHALGPVPLWIETSKRILKSVNVTVERIADSQVRLQITADPEEHTKAVDKAYRRISRDINVPGFGKERRLAR